MKFAVKKKQEPKRKEKYEQPIRRTHQELGAVGHTRRAALKKFGVGLAGIALARFGLANKMVSPITALTAP